MPITKLPRFPINNERQTAAPGHRNRNNGKDADFIRLLRQPNSQVKENETEKKPHLCSHLHNF